MSLAPQKIHPNAFFHFSINFSKKKIPNYFFTSSSFHVPRTTDTINPQLISSRLFPSGYRRTIGNFPFVLRAFQFRIFPFHSQYKPSENIFCWSASLSHALRFATEKHFHPLKLALRTIVIPLVGWSKCWCNLLLEFSHFSSQSAEIFSQASWNVCFLLQSTSVSIH